jgi:hypothetical protein
LVILISTVAVDGVTAVFLDTVLQLTATLSYEKLASGPEN